MNCILIKRGTSNTQTNTNIGGQCHPKVKAATSVLLVQIGELQRCPAHRRTLGQKDLSVLTPGPQASGLWDRETGCRTWLRQPEQTDTPTHWEPLISRKITVVPSLRLSPGGFLRGIRQATRATTRRGAGRQRTVGGVTGAEARARSRVPGHPQVSAPACPSAPAPLLRLLCPRARLTPARARRP